MVKPRPNNITNSDFLRLFTEDRVLVDTRAPIEFEKGSFPAAINLPLMNNAEREQVGICYAEVGQEAAVAIGHELVSGDIKAARLSSWINALKREPNAAFFCFRGGLRSQTTQGWLRECGFHVPLVEGGYKALRRFLIDSLETSLRELNVVVVAGRTGVAKTAMLNHCDESSRLATIDLEGLANHRGSAFGKRVKPQPSQIDFENAVSISFLKAWHGEVQTAAVEDESRLIGRCALPLPLQACLASSPVVTIEASLNERVNHSWENYILQNHKDWCDAHADEEYAFEVFAESLRTSMQNIQKRLGGVRYSALSKVLEDAISEHRAGNADAHKKWIEILLRDYYDPMYDYQLQSKERRVVFSGSFNEVIGYLQA
ncbi:MAG: tRNA 2-selenouridine(34) synthase MnmH [Halieaceae bacterium]